jgi:D-beta-D-heptose 7-phosphate kinase/D-beta-D-heptose 1-phosphate adenosyltransferase
MITAFVNGCFDILHVGHINMLTFAKASAIKLAEPKFMLARLVVAINSDDSYCKLRNKRPYHNEFERRQMLLALKVVNEVFIFDEDSPRKLIDEMQPTFVVKGPDYLNSHRDKTYGIIPILIYHGNGKKHSTTAIKERE